MDTIQAFSPTKSSARNPGTDGRAAVQGMAVSGKDSVASQSSDEAMGFFDSFGDGTVDRIWRSKPKGPIASIYVHAGAGYHSAANEKIHLEACNE